MKINFTEPLKDHCKFSNRILLAIASNSLRILPKTELNKSCELLINNSLIMACKLKKESSYLAFLKNKKSTKGLF